MSEEIPAEKSVAAALSGAVEKLRALKVSVEKKDRLLHLSTDTENNVSSIWQTIEHLPDEIEEDFSILHGIAAAISDAKRSLQAKLDYVQRKNKETAEKKEAFLEAQDKEFQARVDHLEAVQKECHHFQNVLTQKEAAIAGYHQQLKAETKKMKKQNRVLMLETEKSKFSQAEKEFKSSSTELENVFKDHENKIKNLRELITASSKELETVTADNISKTVELAAARSRVESARVMADREKQENLKILTDLETVELNRNAIIDDLEAQLAVEREKHEKAKNVNTDLIEKIHSEFGHSKSLEEMTVQAATDLKALELQRSQLSETVDTIRQTMKSNETKLARLYEGKHSFLQRPRRNRSERAVSTETSGPVFLMPRGMPKKVKIRVHQQQPGQQEVEADRVVRSGTNSSASEFGM